MNKFGIAGLISIAGAVFYACGDSTSSNSTMDLPGDQETVTEVGSVYELGKCKDDRKGTIIFVKNENREYVCYSGKWSPLDEIGSVEESSSSTEKKESSSSEGKDVSSSSLQEDEVSSDLGKEESSSSQKDVSSSSSQEVDDTPDGKDEVSSSSEQKEESSSSIKSEESSSSDKDEESSSSVKSEETTSSSSSVKDEGGSVESSFFKDPRDNHVYRIVKIGNQTWFAQNLQYAGPVGSSRCHSDDYIQCDVYGRLYQRDKAMTACPTGWHLPSLDEWKVLFEYVGGTNVAGIKLKSRSNWVLQENFEKYAGIDEYNFSILPASFATSTGVYGSTIKFDSHLWTSSVDADGYNVMVYFLHSMGGVGISSVSENLYYSVRCLQDN